MSHSASLNLLQQSTGTEGVGFDNQKQAQTQYQQATQMGGQLADYINQNMSSPPHIDEVSQGSTAQSVSIQELGVANDTSDALPLPQKPSVEVPNVTEDASFCLESLSRLETNDITSQAQLIALWGEMERRGQQCESLLPGDFWVRASSAIGVAADALEQRENRLESAARLLREALRHGVDTIRCLLSRWDVVQRWEAILRLEENSSEDMQRLMEIAPNWAQWCEGVMT